MINPEILLSLQPQNKVNPLRGALMNCKIDIKGLANGKRHYGFHIDGTFFEVYENDTISDADVNVDVVLVKDAGMMTVEMDVEGTVVVSCDRCLADLSLPVKVGQKFSVRFAGGGMDDAEGADDEIQVKGDGSELDLSQVIYDYVCTALPIRKVHEDGKCDPEMMEKMKDIIF